MNCKKTKKLINEYLDYMLPEHEKTSFELHIVSCRECSRQLRETEKVVSLVRALNPEEVPEGFRAGLKSAVEKSEVQKVAIAPKRASYTGWARWVGAAAALILVLMGTVTDRVDVSAPRQVPGPARMLMESAPAQNDAVQEEASIAAALEPPAADRQLDEKAREQEGRSFIVQEARINTNAVELLAHNALVTTQTVRDIALKHGIEVLDLTCQGITLLLGSGHREILYQELSLLGEVIDVGEQLDTDTVAIVITNAIE